MNTGASPGINDVDGSDDDRIDEDGSDPDATGSGADECAHSTEHTGTRAQWWLDPGLARLAFGSNSSQQRTGLDAGHLGLDLPQMLELDLSDPAQRDFGDYELREVIGRGGMGVVYRAHQRSLDREVALKLLSAGVWASGEYVATLRREAQHAALLQHPNIVTVYEIGEQHGLIYYAMQLLGGSSLAARLQQDGPLPPRAAAQILSSVADALDYAHRLGVLHLDLKPGNVLLEEDGTPRIADFGLARRLGVAGNADNERVSGTPSYMAPEQARVGAAQLSRATDVWGLGALLYEMLTGKPPFTAATPGETLRLVQEGRVRSLGRTAPVPPDLEAICQRCLAKNPAERYASARELANDLGRFLDGRAVSVRHLNVAQRLARWARREPRLAAVASLALVALFAGIIATSVQWRRAEDNTVRAVQTLRAQRALAMQRANAIRRDYDALPGIAANLEVSERIGDTVGAAQERLRLGLTFAALPQLIDRFKLPQRLRSLALSPDGRRLAIGTLESSEVMLFDTADGRELWRVSLAREPSFWSLDDDPREVNHLQFSSDGRYLVASNHWPFPVISPSGMDDWRIDVASGALARPRSLFAGMTDATYSADGRHALLRSHSRQEVQLWDAQTWEPLSRTASYSRENPGWLIAPQARFVANWDSSGVRILDPHTLSIRFNYATGARYNDVSFSAWDASPDGRWLALGTTQGEVVLIDPITGARRRLLPGPASTVHWLQFNRDGRWLVAGSEDDSVWLWRQDDDFSHGRQIQVDTPVWSVAADPDTGLVRIGGMDAVSVWQVSGLTDADRAAQPRAPFFRQPVPRYASDLHAASGLLVTASEDEGEVRLWRLPATPLRGSIAAPQMTTQLDFDGEHLVAVDGRQAVVVRAADGRPVSPAFLHPQPIGFAALSGDGASLVTSSGRELRVFDWRRGRLRFPPLLLPNSPMKLAVDPRGRRLYVSYTVERARTYTEALAGFSLGDGRSLANPIEIADGLGTFMLTPDGDRVLLATAQSVDVRDAVSLQRVGQLKGPSGQEMYAVAASRQPVRIATAGFPPAAISTYDLRSARWLAPIPTSEQPIGVAISPDGALRVTLLPGSHAIELLRDDGIRQRIDAPSGTQLVRSAVFSPDGRVLAQAVSDGVLLLDATSGQWLAPPLRTPIPAPDVVAQLAFSPDGSRLLARSYFGRWLWWRLDADRRGAAAITHQAQVLAAMHGRSAAAASAEERRSLRRFDPGPTRLAAPPFPLNSCLAPAAPPLPRDPATPANLLDLAPYAAFNPRRHDLVSPWGFRIGNLCALPQGMQRIGGVDFDLRATLAADAEGSSQLHTIAAGIPVPAAFARIAAFEMLATSTTFVRYPPWQSQPTIAQVVLHYVDGSTARAPLRYGRDVVMWNVETSTAASNLGWALQLPEAESGIFYASGNLFRVRLVNPHPERAVRSFDLEALPVTWNGIAVLAISLDPAAMSPTATARQPAAPIPGTR